MKPFYSSRTFWFNVLVALVSLAGLFGFQAFQPDAKTADLIGAVVALVGVILRFATTQPVAGPLANRQPSEE